MADSVLWRSTSGSGAESNGEVLEFNQGAVPDATGAIIETSVKFEVGFADNPKAAGKINELQDTGLARIILTITGRIKAPKISSIPDVLKRWLIEDKTNTIFTKGRFGLRMNDFPQFNMKPELNRGYFLIDLEFQREGEYEGRVAFIAILRFNGDPGSPPYAWG